MANRRLLGERVAVRVNGCPPRDGVLISGVKKETKLIQKFPVRFPNGDVRVYRGDQLLLRGTKASFLDFIRVGDVLYTKKTLGVVRFVGMHEDYSGPLLVMESIDPRLPADEKVKSFRKTFPSANLLEGGSYKLIRKLDDILKLLPPDAILTQISKIKDKYLIFKSDTMKKEQRYDAEKERADKQIAELKDMIVEHAEGKHRPIKGDSSHEDMTRDSVPEGAAGTKSEIMFNEIIFHPGRLGIQATWSTGKIDGVSENGQASQLGVEVGWIITHIDNEPYSENLLDSKTLGSEDYLLTFEIPKSDENPDQTNVDFIENASMASAPMEDEITESQRDKYKAKIAELTDQIEDFHTTVETLRRKAEELEEEHKEFNSVHEKVEQLRVSRRMFMGQIKELQKVEKDWIRKAQEFEKKYNKLLRERALVNGEVRKNNEQTGNVRSDKKIRARVQQKNSGRPSKRKHGRLPVPDAANTVQLGNTPKVGEGSSQFMSMSDLKRDSKPDLNKQLSSNSRKKKRSWFN